MKTYYSKYDQNSKGSEELAMRAMVRALIAGGWIGGLEDQVTIELTEGVAPYDGIIRGGGKKLKVEVVRAYANRYDPVTGRLVPEENVRFSRGKVERCYKHGTALLVVLYESDAKGARALEVYAFLPGERGYEVLRDKEIERTHRPGWVHQGSSAGDRQYTSHKRSFIHGIADRIIRVEQGQLTELESVDRQSYTASRIRVRADSCVQDNRIWGVGET
ncbi:hypothetical protein [Meiothermus cerbereus]|jgi:hypothetical protein|uniref:hypothetical protein n=1 Tax=Meiothermus cerbereus TaxID=65552 RepID=UPI000486608E|nr:hypothetical protein [Meiothermus cerbereus]